MKILVNLKHCKISKNFKKYQKLHEKTAKMQFFTYFLKKLKNFYYFFQFLFWLQLNCLALKTFNISIDCFLNILDMLYFSLI